MPSRMLLPSECVQGDKPVPYTALAVGVLVFCLADVELEFGAHGLSFASVSIRELIRL